MRYLLSLTLLMAPAFAQEAAIRAVETQWAAAIKGKDGAALEKLLGDQLIYAHSTGIIDTKKAYIAKVTSGKQRYEGVEHKDMTIRFYGDAAIMHAHMRMWGVNQAGKFDDQLMTLHTWVKRGGAWQLVAHQTTKLK